MVGNQEAKTKRIVKVGYKKGANISYPRFYAIRYTIELELQSPRAIQAFFNISNSTYNRICNCATYPDYKKLVGNRPAAGAELKLPLNAPKTVRTRNRL